MRKRATPGYGGSRASKKPLVRSVCAMMPSSASTMRQHALGAIRQRPMRQRPDRFAGITVAFEFRRDAKRQFDIAFLVRPANQSGGA